MSFRSRIGFILLAAATALLQAQGTKTRDEPSKYSAQAKLGDVRLGAELWGHFIPLDDGETLRSDEYLVVEVAYFAPPNMKVNIDPAQFALKINGQRVLPTSPGLVTLGYMDPDMRERGPRLITDTQIGGGEISTGRDPTQSKFPGDSNPADIPPRQSPRQSPDGLQPAPADPTQAVKDAALPEGSHAAPISGYLYYAYKGKLKRLKHVEVEYAGPLGNATLTLR